MHKDGHVLVAGGSSHWTKLPQMLLWLGHIVRHHVLERAQALGVTEDQMDGVLGLCNIDVYAVHRSAAFRSLFQSSQEDAPPADGGVPTMCIEYVPANCTIKFQIADVALNRCLKAQCQQLYMRHQTEQVRVQLAAGVPPEQLKLETTSLQSRCLPWMLQAYEYTQKRVRMLDALKHLGYLRCWSDKALRTRGMRLLSANGEVEPEEDVDEDARAGVPDEEEGDEEDEAQQQQFWEGVDAA